LHLGCIRRLFNCAFVVLKWCDCAAFPQWQSYSSILKANSRWSPTWANFCQVIASLFAVLPQLNQTKLKLEYLKFGF